MTSQQEFAILIAIGGARAVPLYLFDTPASSPPSADALLLETGGSDALLLETGGSDALLLEDA